MDTNRYELAPDDVAAYERTTLAATFTDRERARDALHQLHDEGFRETWLGIIRSDDAGADTFASQPVGTIDSAATADSDVMPEPRVEADNWFARVFGEGDESLHDALVRHGVSDADARSAGARDLTGIAAIVTVDGANHPEYATEILTGNGGSLITGGVRTARTGMMGGLDAERDVRMPGASADRYDTSSRIAGSPAVDADDAGVAGAGFSGASVAATGEARGSALDDMDPLGTNRTAPDVDSAAAIGRATAQRPLGTSRDVSADEATRMRLREERLRIDTERRQRGEAVVSKDVISQTQEVDVPVTREELFVERRPVSGERARADAGAIGSEPNEIRIPLSEERVRVTKTPIVTEEVVVGKREVGGVEHISETTLKEELNVRDVDTDAPRADRPSARA